MNIRKQTEMELEPEGEWVERDGDLFYRIDNFDKMSPFFMSIVSPDDHWMFISTTGGVSAGRKNPDHAMFPYYTEDKIAELHETTGSKTLFRVRMGKNKALWEPFSFRSDNWFDIERRIYKNGFGNKVIFEEENKDLSLCFSYSYQASRQFGWVKTSRLTNSGESPVNIEVMDGWQNILPSGVTQQTQNEFSVLLDAYKKNELFENSGLAVFRLSSQLTDKAEPSESLLVTGIWSLSEFQRAVYIYNESVHQFRKEKLTPPAAEVRGQRGAYFINGSFSLVTGAEQVWYTIGDTDLDKPAIFSIADKLQKEKSLEKELINDLEDGSERLVSLVAKADGLQGTGSQMAGRHHFANVLFNCMRGGIPENDYTIDRNDFSRFLENRNRLKSKKWITQIADWPRSLSREDLIKRIGNDNDPDFMRNGREYLPLSFSRRHGDPSRPWNRFSINLEDENGNRMLDYQGNWRDIFQNWEALFQSWPGYLDGLKSAFLNATTADGYNPYRVTRNGFEWEVPEPGNPWANIGYWGDHQIIYLLKILEWEEAYFPGRQSAELNVAQYSMAEIPYRIKDYSEILKDYRDTIVFDFTQNEKLYARVTEEGADGKLIHSREGEIIHVSLTEKLLHLFLAKLSAFVPGGGIWMNTQRPEWNDANNALVGPGLSVVTLAYLRRFTQFFSDLISSSSEESFILSQSVAVLVDQMFAVLNGTFSNPGISPAQRRLFMDRMGESVSGFRKKLYNSGFSVEKSSLPKQRLVSFLELSLGYFDASLTQLKREDGLYHSYTLLNFDNNGGVSIEPLNEMLEGQVAILSSGLLSPEEASDLLDNLKRSRLFRLDQNSYRLYPDKRLPAFGEVNTIKEESILAIPLLKEMAAKKDRQIIQADGRGGYVFNAAFKNAGVLHNQLESLGEANEWGNIEKDKTLILDLYEKVFDHKSFTGRSGTFFAYEGLGSIYWHMVSKLLLAVQDNFDACPDVKKELKTKLKKQYYDIREGLGFNKTPAEYGAFPQDPYSHTPANGGARQPGMTGQVKEEILTRRRELGVSLKKACYCFKTDLLVEDEWLTQSSRFSFRHIDESREIFELDRESYFFSLNQVPVMCKKGESAKIRVKLWNGETRQIEGNTLSSDFSQSLFWRKQEIRTLEVIFDSPE